MLSRWLLLILALVGCAPLQTAYPLPESEAWARHALGRDGSGGADGVSLGDINQDGRLDIVTAFEEGDRIAVFLAPDVCKVREFWPQMRIAHIADGEDAVFADLDGDGYLEVATAHEGEQREIRIHQLRGGQWFSFSVAETRQRLWLQLLPLDVDGDGDLDLVAGSKTVAGKKESLQGELGWLENPGHADFSKWPFHHWRPAEWIMSLVEVDMDGDGDTDVLFSERYGPQSGIYWLARGGPGAAWELQPLLTGPDVQPLFVAAADVNGDGWPDVVFPNQANGRVGILFGGADATAYRLEEIVLPGIGRPKAVAVGDLDEDGDNDIVLTLELEEESAGALWFEQQPGGIWQPHDLSGSAGIKFDNVLLNDLDGDGDLDVLTSEETVGLGVVWYENPLRAAQPCQFP